MGCTYSSGGKMRISGKNHHNMFIFLLIDGIAMGSSVSLVITDISPDGIAMGSSVSLVITDISPDWGAEAAPVSEILCSLVCTIPGDERSRKNNIKF
jgi:hypothetical protein